MTTPISGTTLDFEPVVGIVLRFEVGESRICHNITIVNDDECEEPAEFFFSNLTLGAVGDPPISLTNTPARITIDDTDEPECSELMHC